MPDFSLGFGHSLSPQTPATFPPRFGGANRPSQRGTIPRKSPYFGCGIMRPRPFPTPPRGTGPPVFGPPDTGNGRVSMAPQVPSPQPALPSRNSGNGLNGETSACLLYTSPSPRDGL